MKHYASVEYLRSQKDMPHANYRKYLVNVYNFYYKKIQDGNGEWCVRDTRSLHKCITEGCYKPDCSFSAAKRYEQEMHDRKYIKIVADSGVERIYIVKELDF